ncbi:MAG: electron transporter RnfG, partial [Oscillibacter sp.]|nr:electron transporter RnfG [Oscillibacter sp.]
MSTANKEKVQMDPAYIIKLTVTLLVTCVVVAAALGGVNAVTEEKIDAINWAKTVEAMKAVVA